METNDGLGQGWGGVVRNHKRGVTANRCRVSHGGDKNVLELMLVAA